ncbi:flavin reductase (DIM6/NTAB) family NADH-FMN oxidoreductase RutF [Rhodoglobus vestalii]|uniref:Flavin reductase (DIM6/NTAB) family NADH-FMN oxidoreductase RutF n=1 Tax=Rhodoglobus vestalii TaxID=193384 RepID=A0A8H2K6T4_9MICO|nr:flavin reductase family protein [Rhodoglobus vestalii]TQO18731.1 flavin reductase (DIM6/NTAB) family NADH-FMN oxidoreductase RutF [Rhodoglobus vestalii]
MDNSAATIGIDAFKSAFRRHAAGVAVVTSIAPDGRPVGFTATSLASLAAVPPLATFNMAQISSSWPAITVGNLVAIHMIGPRSRHLAERMAADHDLRFVGDHWHADDSGLPLLDGATAIAIGRIIDVHPVHNNAVVVVEIDHGILGDEDEALIYHERAYMRPHSLDN